MSDSYPSDWDQRRKKVYQRDNYTCQNCGAQGGPHGNAELHAHHIVPKGKGGTHEVSNLKTICNECHSAIHNENVYAPTDPDVALSQNSSNRGASKKASLLPIVSSKYPTELEPQIKRANIVYRISKELDEISEEEGEFFELYSTIKNTPNPNLPIIERLAEQKESIDSIIENVKNKKQELNSFDKESMNEKGKKQHKQYNKILDEYIDILDDYYSEVAKSAIDDGHQVENNDIFYLMRKRIIDLNDDLSSATQKYIKYLTKDVKEYDREMAKQEKNKLRNILMVGGLIEFVLLISLSFSLPDFLHGIIVLIMIITGLYMWEMRERYHSF